MCRRLRAGLADETGVVLPRALLLLPILLGFSALVLDVGVLYAHRRSLQNAADAAALAGAIELRRDLLGTPGDPPGQARAVAARNGVAGPGPACSPDGRATLVSSGTPAGGTAQSWQVETSRQVRLIE